ncbi:AAA family ATPase [Variovorax sp. J22R24]|uniref:AAA family ATPase n=1 Tax=Variovorax gracilis TaxID=3053502 RepID=UPI0025785104|nr:AAA family ATPase [Variovorax sp. J22R24]MDM0106333.1 AAA family ATPase [Variovorax sp. J22R24]
MNKVQDWLEKHRLTQLAEILEREQIDWDALLVLSAEDLKDLGLPIGLRAKFSAALQSLREGASISNPLADTRPEAAGEVAGARDEGERRQLTALFCDMVGFTELANRLDPEVLQRIVRRYEQVCSVCIARYEGYVFQLLGDGIVAFFGYPLAHEGEAERAIRAGLEIIDSLSKLDIPDVGRLAVRIGIATGVVVVSSAGKVAVGEAMNLAARLQGLAEPGRVLVSDRVHRLARGSFDYEALGEQMLKGIAKPQHVYCVLGVSEVVSRFDAATQEGLTPLIGREQEIGLLLERWSLAQESEGQVVVLSGEPGIGKSRILNAFQERVESRGANALRFHCSPYYVNSAFWPTTTNFERALKFNRDEPPAVKLEKLEDLIVNVYGRPLADVGYIASMMSIPCDDRYGTSAVTSQKRKQEILRTLVDLTEATARRHPSVMLFEDVHWADPTSLEVLDLLIDRVRTIPLLIVLTHRPEFQSRWSEQGHVSALNLSKLSRAQGAALVSRLAGGKALPEALLEEILARTDGVPLFLEELTKAIFESGELTEKVDHYAFRGAASGITIPATLRDSLMARLDRFNPVKDIAQIGAAIGRAFSYELIAAIAPMTQEQLDDSLAQLTDSGLASRRGIPPEATYTFKHALVQDVAYDSLLKSRRQELHAKIARAIEERFADMKATQPEVLAHHLTAAGLAAAAIPQWQSAGELALKRMALIEAISHLNQGLKLVPTLPGSVEIERRELALRRALGVCWMASKGWPAPEARDSLLPALRLVRSAASGRDVVPVYWGLFSNTLSQGRVAESVEWAEQLLAMGQQKDDSDILVTAHLMMSVSTFWLGKLLTSRAHAEALASIYDPAKHRHIADAINHDPLTGAGVYLAQVSWMLGFPDRAVAECNAKDEHARARGHVFDLGFALCAGADVFEYRCEPEAQRARVQESERLGRENGLTVLWQVMAPLRYGTSSIRAGKVAEGVGLLQAGLAMRESGGGYGGSNPYLKALLAEGMALGGDIPGALRIIEMQIEQVERPGWGERSHYAEIRRLEGWLHELRGDAEAAEASYRISLDWARSQQARSWELRTATSLAQMLQKQQRSAEGHALLAPVYDWFTEGFETRDLLRAREVIEALRREA